METINLWIATVLIAMSSIALHLYYQGKVLAEPHNSKKIGEGMKKASWVWFLVLAGLFTAFIVINWPLRIG